jgi:aspartate/methionine/tyrosine aminotransferase
MSHVNIHLRDAVAVPPIPAFKVKARSLRPASGRTFDMSQAVPAFPTFSKIRECLGEDLRNDALSFYTEVPGLEKLRCMVLEGHHLLGGCSVDQILITSGANHAMYTAMLTMMAPGDKLVLPEPFYFNYDMALPMLGIKPVYCPMSADHGMALDAESMIAFLRTKGQGAKALLLITPNNPTGARYEPSEILRLLEWTSSHGVEVILDETYRWFDEIHLNDSRLARFVGNGLTLVGSFSKAFSLTGYRVGYWIASKQQIGEAMKVQDTLVICPSHIGQWAAIRGLEHCMGDVRKKSEEMKALVQVVTKCNKRLKHFRFVSAGAFFAYLQHPFKDMSAEAACLKLYEKTGILGLPGSVFGKSQEGFVRLSVCNLSPDDLADALALLERWDADC